MKVIGIEDVNYVSKKTGKTVTGVKLHLTYPLDEKGEGEGVLTEFCGSNISIASSLIVGDEVEILYNRFGGIADLKVVS